MVTYLVKLIDEFIPESCMPCFLHITNFVACQILTPFNIEPKKKADTVDNQISSDNNNEEDDNLQGLAIEKENNDDDDNIVALIDNGGADDDGKNDADDDEDNNMEGWVDEQDYLDDLKKSQL
ncbi:hypothetical protein FISHEDRAFT_60353 [Fistulina hepatica ATCC 64428]|uniref:Uncharacterized protein n=1 Tax=Fistulina hepatica ATCC 64428 TaxID=1128425 RepID=A0A0D7A7T6_9AGAR|nr:hypothetical protein FISHEDRAFT_60353 [Fistulina hepatica ATCC 64428]